MARVPGRGDLYRVDLEPTKGKEQRGRRYVFVLSPAEHNRRGLVIALTDRQGETLARSAGYAATLATHPTLWWPARLLLALTSSFPATAIRRAMGL